MISRHSTAATLALLASLLLAVLHCYADPVLPALFTDHMVLQRNHPVRVWGIADAGEAISISLNGRTAAAMTASDGKWTVILPPMAAGGPFTLVVSGKRTIAIRDVMVGEVWIASGQSNMDYALAGSAGATAELQQADHPDIRLFKVPLHSSLEPQHSVSSAWTLCTPETARHFSAVAYYFARDLNLALNTPIGIIQSSWSGSLAEEWTDPASLESSPELLPILERWRHAPQAVKDFAQYGGSFNLQFDDFQLLPSGKDTGSPHILTNFDDGQARTVGGGYWRTSPPGTLELTRPGHGGSGYAASFAGVTSLAILPTLRAGLHANDSDNDAVSELSGYSGIRFYARGKGCFHTQLALPSIVDGDNYAAASVCATEEWQPFTALFKDLKQAGWGVKQPLILDRASAFVIDTNAGVNGEGTRPPSGLYHGMIAPLAGYGMRGAIWYQGEGNTSRAYQYRTLLPAMINGWRRAWGEGDFPLLIVQLPNLGRPKLNAEDSSWAELREAQLLTLKTVPATGLAVTIDLGEAENLHPPRKAEVGQRLARWALGDVYGRPIEYSGPLLESTEIQGSNIRLRFSHAGGLSARGGGPLQGFAIAGADRKFVPATAVIQDAVVTVSNPQVHLPVAVRYAWAGNPLCNLVNGTGLPASPFRTDHWIDVTQNER